MLLMIFKKYEYKINEFEKKKKSILSSIESGLAFISVVQNE